MKKLALAAPRPWSAIALAAIALSFAAPSARAGSCVRIDTARDTLNPEEQKAAALLFEAALAGEGRALDSVTCSEEWVLSHVRLGKSITVVVASPHGRRSDHVSAIEELPAQYSQSIRALLTRRNPNELFRASTVRLFVQADGILATYEVTRRPWEPAGRTSPEERFRPATLAVSLGIGFGGGRHGDDD